MRKRKLLIAAVLALSLLGGMSTGVLAYLHDTGSLANRLTPGHNEIEVTEHYDPPPELHQGDNTFTKDVQITNTGTVPCYVRVFCDFSDSTIADKAFLSTQDLKANPTWTSASDFKTTPPEGWEYIPLTDGTLGGFFYYTKPLQPGEATPYLLRSVKVHFNTAEEVKAFEIIVSAESVQTRDHLGAEGEWKAIWTEFLNRR